MLSESGAIKTVWAGWQTTYSWPLSDKELKDIIMPFLSQTLTENHSKLQTQNCRPPNKSV